MDLALSIVHAGMVSRALLSPTDLTGAQALRLHESTEVVVVSQHESFVLTAFEIVPPILEGLDVTSSSSS